MTRTRMALAACELLLLCIVAILSVPSAHSALSAPLDLDDDTFDNHVLTPANEEDVDLWLLDFYAPWCGHCKRLNPVLDELAAKLTGRLNIGKIDATSSKGLAERYQVKSFPTLMWAKSGKVNSYRGPRALEDFEAFVKRMEEPSVKVVTSFDELISKSKGEEVIYILNTQEGDLESIRNFELVAEANQDHMRFFMNEKEGLASQLAKEELPLPHLTRAELEEDEEGNVQVVSSVYPGSWAKEQLEEVMGVVDANSSSTTRPFVGALRRLARGKSSLAEEDHSRFVFGYIDGYSWKRFVEQFNVKLESLPQVVVLDNQNKRFWADPLVDEEEEIDTFLSEIAAGKIEAFHQNYSGRIMHLFWEWMPYSVLVGLPLIMLPLLCYVSMGRDEDETEYRGHNRAEPSATAKSKEE